MGFNLNKVVALPWEEAIAKVKGSLKLQGFGVLTEIDVQATLRDKIGAKIGRYLILGACNPAFANQAIAAESRIGVLLPCNVILRELGEGSVEVATVNPAETMKAVGNPALEPLGAEVASRLAKMLEDL